MSFLGGLFTGNSPTLTQDENNAGNVAGFGQTVGEGDISAASGFDEALLAGNPAETAKLLAPQISNIQKQGQQQLNTAAQFGNRSGGTNASAQNNIDTQRSNVNDMVSQLTGNAASSLGNLGESSLGLGLTANDQQAKLAQQIQQNQRSSILGGAITGGVDLGLDALTGEIGGAGGGGATAGTPGSTAGLVQAGNNLGLATDDELGDVTF